MFKPNELVVTEIFEPITVFSPKGKYLEQKSRRTCGISLCLGGQIQYISKGKSVISDETNIVFLPKGAKYALIGMSDGRFPLINFDCKEDVGDEVLLFPVADKAACIRLYERIKDLFLLKGSRLEIYACFYELLQLAFAGEEAHTGYLGEAISYIDEHLFETDLTNERIASELGISEVYLRKLFRNGFHTTPKQYILGLRLARAKQLLCHTSFSVTRISEECGFSCVYHFCRSFKNKVGCTPGEFAADRSVGEAKALLGI
ncbi:MAG: helix-turn-helix transcriptional regulator [Clostridia bacterium]|nr:helix-turn-helix transcriptional regulator [Clostridia bacterium]